LTQYNKETKEKGKKGGTTLKRRTQKPTGCREGNLKKQTEKIYP